MLKMEELTGLLKKNEKIPYPDIPKLYPNKQYATMLYNDFAGELGELTAITQYIYEHISLKENNAISQFMLTVAIQEMKHLDIVGNIIKALGEKAYFENSQKECWTAKNVKYCAGDIKETMKYNISTEEAAIEGYRKAIMYTRNMQLRRIFERIILDEKIHIEVFKKISQFGDCP